MSACTTSTSIHIRSWGQQPKQENPEIPLTGHLHQLILWDIEVFPGQAKHIIPP